MCPLEACVYKSESYCPYRPKEKKKKVKYILDNFAPLSRQMKFILVWTKEIKDIMV